MSHAYIIDSPRSLSLADYDPDDTGSLSHDDAEKQTDEFKNRLLELQDLLYGAARQSVLVILQGLDTSGKDGTIKHVMSHVNPVGCQVWSFKVPTAEELSHDFLWRVHKRTPANGMFAIFNRSHYEDVLVARVHGLVPEDVWSKRYEQINHFEQMLALNNTIICKFFLHISKGEQKQRLLAREQDPEKWWKLSLADWQERAYWDAYQEAYADAIGRCGTSWAPWHIIPANKKWYRDFAIARALIERLSPYRQRWRDELQERGKTELERIRAAHIQEE
ncbi:MAG TPA: PPK2 family polyphosphate kinase [Ktedonobacterales bacterium]